MDGVIDVKRHNYNKNEILTQRVSDYCDILENKINVNNLGDEIVDWIRIDDLQNDPSGIDAIRTLSANVMDGNFFEVVPGDVLVARLGPTILNQKIVKVKNTCRRTLASAEFLVLRCRENDVSNEMMCVLRTEYYRKLMYSHSRGSTPSRYRLNREDMLSLPFPLLDKKSNQAAKVMLSALQTRSDKSHEAEELLAGMDGFALEQLGINLIPIQSRISIAVTLGTLKADNTMGADYYHLERLSVIKALENGPILSTRKLADIVDFFRDIVSANSKPYLGLAGVMSNTGELSGVEEEVEGQAFAYSAGDVLYARLRPYLNKVLYAENDGVCSTEFHVMRVNSADVLPEYIAVILRSKITVAQTKHMMTGNTHPRISNEDVRNLRIPVPEPDIQQVIVDEMRRRIERSRLLKREAESEWTAARERFERELIGAII